VIKHEPLRKSLARLNKHPDLKTKAMLKPGVEELTSDLRVEVDEKMPIHLSADVNNFGTRLTGKVRGGATLAFNNLTGNLDRLVGRAVVSDGSVSGAVDYSVPIIPDWGTRLGGSYNYVKTDLEKDFRVLKAEGDSETYSVYIDQPAYESKHLDVSMRFGFDHRSIEQRLLNAISGKDDIRRFNIGIDFQEKDIYGRTFWEQTFHVGVDAFGASGKNDDNLTRANTGAPYFVYRASLDRYLFLPYNFMFVLRGATQLSGDKLSPSEQFQIGGVNSVRGYPQGEFLGDIGATASAEAIIPMLYFLPETWRLPFSDKPIRDQIKGLAFIDYGSAYLEAALAGEQKHKDIAGAGLGLRIQIMDRIFSRVAWARPITDDDPSDGTDDFFYYSVGVELF